AANEDLATSVERCRSGQPDYNPPIALDLPLANQTNPWKPPTFSSNTPPAAASSTASASSAPPSPAPVFPASSRPEPAPPPPPPPVSSAPTAPARTSPSPNSVGQPAPTQI